MLSGKFGKYLRYACGQCPVQKRKDDCGTLRSCNMQPRAIVQSEIQCQCICICTFSVAVNSIFPPPKPVYLSTTLPLSIYSYGAAVQTLKFDWHSDQHDPPSPSPPSLNLCGKQAATPSPRAVQAVPLGLHQSCDAESVSQSVGRSVSQSGSRRERDLCQ